MKATSFDISQSSNRKNILGVSKSEQKPIPFFNLEDFVNDQKKKDLLNMPLNNALENGGHNNFFPQKKRNYRDLYITNIDDIPQTNNSNISNNININDNKKRNPINYKYFNEPSLINKIRRNENIIDNQNNNNNLNNNNINDNISYNEQNDNNFNQINDVENKINNNEEEQNNKKVLEENIEKKKKILDEYLALEKVLKEDQNLFLDDNYHILNSNEYERIPEELSSFIISKRVNFPREIYQSFSSIDNNEIIGQNPQNEKNAKDNYTVIYPPLNCIVFVQNNKFTFFNYINEKSFIYEDFIKPIKKLLITVPKPGIFKDIQFIMICIMDGEIQLLSLSFKNNEDELPIIRKTDYIITFNETVLDLISTANHRIFISTLNNKIYELDYSFEQNSYFDFFGPRSTLKAINKEKPIFFGLFADIKYIINSTIEIIHKLKVDNTRNLLYALKYTIPKDEKTINLDKVIDSSVIIFDLGIDGKEFTKVKEISQEDLGDYGLDFEFNNYNFYNEDDINENNKLIQKSNIIVDITPLTRDKFKDYQLLVIKRNGHKIFLNFFIFEDDSKIKDQDEILKFNNSAFCRNRITESFKCDIKQINISKYNNFNPNSRQTILYDIINYFPFCTFCYYKNNILKVEDENMEEYVLNVIEDNFANIASKENMRIFNKNEGLKETEELIFKSTTNNKQLYSITKLSDYNLEDSCGLGNLLKSANNYFVSKNIKYIDNSLTEPVTFNCMHEYAKQLFYSPEEYAMLFSDEFVIFQKLRPIDTLIEIMQYKNYKNNLINDKDNININNDISSISEKDFGPNLISNEISSHRKRISIPSLLWNKNKLNNPFQINKDKIIAQKFNDFINIHGYIETTVMLLNIITNNNFFYNIKNKIESPNIISNLDIMADKNNKSYSNIKSNERFLNVEDLQTCYFNPYTLTKFKNDNQLMKMGQEFLMKLFLYAKQGIDIQINNYQNLLQNLLNNLNLNKELFSVNNNNNNFRFRINNNFENNFIQNNLFEAKNFMSYGFILFLSRIVRLFWEENIFIRSKLYLQSDNYDFYIVNNLNQNQIMFIKNLLIKFINTINQYKIDFLQQASDITSKSNKLKNYLNDIDQFLNNNSGYIINEVKRKLSIEEQNILNQHKIFLNYFLSIFNFQKFANDLDIIVSIANRIIEILNFLDTIYRINITRELKERKSYNALKIKIKDLFKGNYPFVINELLQIIYELYLKEKNMEFASIKIQEIIQQCPNIVNKNDANAIEGNFILKFCNYNEMDNIDKIKYIKEAIEKINLNLLSVKIEEVVNYLSKFQDLQNIINFCLKKGKLLQSEINNNIDRNPNKILSLNNNDLSLFNINNKENEEENKNDINKIQLENNDTEFYRCINIILTILYYLHKSYLHNSFENYIKINSPNMNKFSYPIYIANLLTNKSPNDYLEMENIILNLVFNEQYEYIHYNIINFLNENKMMNKLQEINSLSIEKYLNNQINLNNNSPQSLFSMFNFYFKNKNYSCATKILANLINYKNSVTNLNNENKNNNYVSLDDRITYVNTMLRTIELQIKDAEYIQLPEQKMKEIQEAKELKEKMINIRNILNIQNEIKSYLSTYVNNTININNQNNNIDLDNFIIAIHKLDNELISLNDLYQKYAKQFSIFDSCISILFEIKFANTNNKVDTKEIRNIYCDYFCKFDDRTLEENWPFINFERFTRIFNTLIKEKTQYQNFYNMLQNNGMKNKYRDIIPLEFIIAIIESMNRRIIFYKDNFNHNDNYYLIKLRQNFSIRENPFWLISYLKEQIFLPYSFIFNAYYIIYLSVCKDLYPRKNNNIINDFISNRSNLNNENLSVNSFNSNNISGLNNSSYEDYGMVFDGNLNRDLNKKKSQDAKFYSLFLLLGIAKLWSNRIIDIIDNNNDFYLETHLKSQDELDLKQFILEIKKNRNQKIKNLIKEYFEELKKFNLIYSDQKYVYLQKYGEVIDEEMKSAVEKVNNFYSEKKKSYDNDEYYDNYNNQNKFKSDYQNKILKISFVGDRNMPNNFMPFTNSKAGGNFINMMGK